MIQQAAKRLSPIEEAMVRSVLAGGGAEPDAFARAGKPLRIDQSIQLGHLRRLQDVVKHQIAMKIEKVLLKLPVRSVHGHSLLVFAGTAASPPRCTAPSASPTRSGPRVNANMPLPTRGIPVIRPAIDAAVPAKGQRRLRPPATLPTRGDRASRRPGVGPNPSGRTAMSESRFTTLTPETMTTDQKRVADAIQSGPRGAGLRGPFNALLRSPDLCDLVQRLGAFVRFGTSIPQRLNEMAIIMAGRKWTAQYEFYAHRRLALEAGLSPAIADAIAANQRPTGMAKDEETVYDFVSELLATGGVSDRTFQRVKDAFGERGVVDLVGAVGYYSLVSMTLNVAQVPLPAGVTPPLK